MATGQEKSQGNFISLQGQGKRILQNGQGKFYIPRKSGKGQGILTQNCLAVIQFE